MIKVNGSLIIKETLFWLILFGIIYYISTYGGSTFKEGIIEMTTNPSYIIIGIVGVVWSASASMSTTMTVLNRALALKEMRSFTQRRILSFGLVLVFGVSLFALTNLMVFSEQIDGLLRQNGHLTHELPSLAMVLGKVAAVSGTFMGSALVYRYVPAEKQDWSATVPGSILWTCVVAFFQF